MPTEPLQRTIERRKLAALAQPKTETERFAAYLLDPRGDHHDLTEPELGRLDTLDKIDGLLRLYGDPAKVTNMVKKMHKRRGVLWSRAEARRLVNQCIELFGSTQSINKPYWRSVIMAQAMRVFHRAMEIDDMTAATQALGKVITALRLDQPDDENGDATTPAPTFILKVQAGSEQALFDLTNVGHLTEGQREQLLVMLDEEHMKAELELIEGQDYTVEGRPSAEGPAPAEPPADA